MIRKSFVGLLGLVLASTANADWALNMPRGVTDLSVETYDLHMMVFWWCVAIGVIVFGVMIISLFRHRKSQGAEPASFSHSTAAEVIWTAIPVVILLIMAVPAAETMVKLEDTRDPDISMSSRPTSGSGITNTRTRASSFTPASLVRALPPVPGNPALT